MVKRRISIFGATGSIGASTLDLIRQHRDSFEVITLSAYRDAEKLGKLAVEFQAQHAVIADEACLPSLKNTLDGTTTTVHGGKAALNILAADNADVIVMAISGAAGLEPSFAAAGTGAHLALANKESIVCAGTLLMAKAAETGTKILPVDSEHNAVFQILDGRDLNGLKKITLTASGGPFRTWPIEKIAQATPQDALAHPVWKMGDKISVDCASLMNKGLELIEAQHLFGLQPDQLDVLVHPQSVIHALAEFSDGSVIAQLANPDMRVAISSCLNWPQRVFSGAKPLDLAALRALEFEQADQLRFPCLRLAFQAMRAGGAIPCILNTANEVAVSAFLNKQIAFSTISKVIEDCMMRLAGENAPQTLNDVLQIDTKTRQFAVSLLPYYDATPSKASA